MSNKENNKDKEEKEEKKIESAAEEQNVENREEQPDVENETETLLAEMKEQLATLNEKYLLLYADFENFRKRTRDEKNDLLLNGSREMIKEILPVIDDFERALAATGNDEGVSLIYNKLMKILEKKGLRAMEAKGEKFDDEMHEAISRVPAAEEEQKGRVMEVVEKGYYLNDKVLRYAKVVVAF